MNRVVGCITHSRLFVDPGHVDPAALYVMSFAPEGDPVPLKSIDGSPSGLKLDVVHQFRLVDENGGKGSPSWRVTTAAYFYGVQDATGRELLAYHWEPEREDGGPVHPHLHVRTSMQRTMPGGETRKLSVGKLHAPTGRVSLEAVVWLLLAELDVMCRHAEPADPYGWERCKVILDEAERRFRGASRRVP